MTPVLLRPRGRTFRRGLADPGPPPPDKYDDLEEGGKGDAPRAVLAEAIFERDGGLELGDADNGKGDFARDEDAE
jgi:hypothetical protein